MNEALFTAHDARKRSQDSLLASTIKAIQKAADLGGWSTHVIVGMLERGRIQDFLRERGFHTSWKPSDSEEGCDIYIDWAP